MISVVVPACNEEGAIVPTIEKLRAVLGACSADGYEILVVDDGSSDRTGALAEESGARVIRHPHNVGYGRSLKDGILAATHETIVITDADLSYPLEEIPTLLAEYARGFDMVVGARTGPHYRESALKAPLRAILTWLVEFTAGRRIPDVNSGLRVFKRSTVMHDLRQLSDTFSFTTSLTLAYMMKRRFVSHLPISYRERVGKTKVRLLRDSLRTLQYIVQAIVFYNPLKIFLLLSILCLVVSMAAAATAIGLDSPEGATIVSGAGVLAALLVFGLGLVADLLRQLLDR